MKDHFKSKLSVGLWSENVSPQKMKCFRGGVALFMLTVLIFSACDDETSGSKRNKVNQRLENANKFWG